MRSCGILCHISSLPSAYGIGTLGREAYRFVDFLKAAGQRYWQMLPIGPTGYGDSPYQSFSSFAGNPYFIDPLLVAEEGFAELPEARDEGDVDYGWLWQSRRHFFENMFSKFRGHESADYGTFLQDHGWWLEDYAAFMTLKDRNGGIAREQFPPEQRIKCTVAEDTEFYKMLQYFFYKQFLSLKQYAAEKGIELIGDIPIYASSDSSDVWAHPELFRLDDQGRAYEIAGCPPDAFTPDGQRWGNPLYDWSAMERDGFEWWHRRLCHQGTLFDKIRIDHFRGFESFFVIDAAEETARNGHWEKGPGISFFNTLKSRGGRYDIIAEDLGYLTPEVERMLRESGYPGMKVLQFAFDSRDTSDYLPFCYPKNSVAYTGTHDNNTILGWYNECDPEVRAYAEEYMRLNGKEGIVPGVIKTVLASPSDTVILCMQDLLEKDGSARMNTPGKAGGNWSWRMRPGEISGALAEKVRALTELYHRLPEETTK